MRELTIELNTSVLDAVLRKAPEVLGTYLQKGLRSAGAYVSRSAKEEAPKSETTLTHAIRAHAVGELQQMVTSHLNYNGMVVTDTQPQGVPPVRSILDWIRVKRIQPHNPKHSQRDLAFIMARSIARKGTVGNDFYDRAADETEDKVAKVLHSSVIHGLNTAGLRGI
ncbi:hypothetical protein [Vibrio spartinae]|uniref:Phage protein, HK97 gp10 family n=1 Tax=Vibrio spartinae TaxID=1918945 RepID=A0A1N6M5F0_9VIBR|nr:hypothetical protein [Vibrio spartinae]SIO94658.1 hypothetical protein VSP9026_02387 [Vibrio spartinae]